MSNQISTDQAHDYRAAFGVVFNRFFVDLQVIFPAWRHALPTTEHLNAAKRQWMHAMIDEGITSQAMIEAGLFKARKEKSDFWPSPATFIAWCKPDAADCGIPDARTAYREAVDNAGRIGKRKWTHAAIHEAANLVGLYELSRMTDADARKAFNAAYREVCDALLSGKVQLALPSPVDQPVDKSARHIPRVIVEKKSPNAHLDDMRRLLGVRK